MKLRNFFKAIGGLLGAVMLGKLGNAGEYRWKTVGDARPVHLREPIVLLADEEPKHRISDYFNVEINLTRVDPRTGKKLGPAYDCGGVGHGKLVTASED